MTQPEVAAAEDAGDVHATIVHLYGPVGIERNGARYQVGGPRERAVLAALVLAAQRPVSVDRLVYWLWAENPPTTARKSLQNAVMRLRRAIEPLGMVIDTVGQAYRLQLGTASIGDAGTDEPLLQVGDTPAVLSARVQLAEIRLTTVERRLAVLVERDAVAAVLELEALVVAHPLRESLWALLIRAHYRAGRQDDALQAFARARAALRDGLGVDPGPQLTELHARVLAHDADLIADQASTARAWLADGIAQSRIGDVSAARASLHCAVEAARAALATSPTQENLTLLADAAAELAGEAEWMVGDAAIEAVLEDVLVRLGDPPQDDVRAGRAHTGLALLRGIRGDARAKVHATRAVRLTRAASPARRSLALWAAATVWEGPDDTEARAHNGRILVDHGRVHDESLALALGHHYLGWAALERGDAESAGRHITASLQAAATSSHPHVTAQAADARFLAALMAGDFAGADTLADELAAAWRGSADPGIAFVLEVSSRLLLGELSCGIDALLSAFAAIRGAMPGELMWTLADALAHALAGRYDKADAVMAGVTASELRGLPRSTTWTGNVSGLAHIADLCGRADLAAVALGLLEPISGRQIVCGGFAYRGSVAHWQAVCLRATGRLDEAETTVRKAISDHESLASEPWLAQSHFALAGVLHEQRRPEQARAELRRATELAGRLGMQPLLERIARTPQT